MSGGNTFCFKRFAVRQNECAMKVGTDGVLLGAWCRVDPRRDKAILDVGTGTGLIALQLAQRTDGLKTNTGARRDAVIEAVEIDPAACETARRNFETSEWAERLVIHPPMSVQEFARAAGWMSDGTEDDVGDEATDGTAGGDVADASPRKFDHIVSNPPYFAGSLASPDIMRNMARHTESLSYDDLMKCCFSLLNSGGRVSLIVPAGSATRSMIAAGVSAGFLPSRLTEVHSTPKSGPKRTLVEFSLTTTIAPATASTCSATLPAPPTETTTLIIGGGAPGTFSEEYRALTRDFYLYF